MEVGRVGIDGLARDSALRAQIGHEQIEERLHLADGTGCAPRRKFKGRGYSLAPTMMPLPCRRTSITSPTRDTTVDGSLGCVPPSRMRSSLGPRNSLMSLA